MQTPYMRFPGVDFTLKLDSRPGMAEKLPTVAHTPSPIRAFMKLSESGQDISPFLSITSSGRTNRDLSPFLL